MSKTCLFCGTKLSETAKFCKGCGKDVTVPAEVNQDIEENLTEKLCTNCGAPLSPTAKFCKNCGYQMSQTDASLQLKDISSEKGVEAVARQTGEKGIGAVARQAVETVMASSTPGDCFLGVGIPSIIPADTAAQISATISVLSPFKVLGDGLITAFKGIKTLGKDKKALGGAIAMAVIWFILTMLSASGAEIGRAHV